VRRWYSRGRPQLCDIAFSSVRRAEARLSALFQLHVLDRFRPHQWPGSAPYHWLLDQAGAAVIAAERGVDVKSLAWRHERALALANSATLKHRVGCNGFFTALLREARMLPDRRLASWWSAWKCAEAWGDIVRPDGYGVWYENGTRLPFVLEYDRGTETGHRLADKLAGYRDLLKLAMSPTWVLFCFESPKREVAARRLLRTSVPLATAALRCGSSPAGAVWLPLHGEQRLRLAELARLDPSSH
jgi:protein involved in plasmid replication-relaxation